MTAGGSEGVFDVEKVQRISEAIRDGKFVVNADAIAAARNGRFPQGLACWVSMA